MSEDYWFVDREGDRRGPVDEDEIARLIKEGAIGRDTQVSSRDKTEWRAASQTPGLAALFGDSTPAPEPTPPPEPTPAQGSPSGLAKGALSSDIPVWGLFWRALVVGFVGALIIPWPWLVAWFYRWFIGRVSLPDGVRLKFIGKAGQIWLMFLLWAVAIGISTAFGSYMPKAVALFGLLIVLLTLLFGIWLFKWVCSHVSSEDERTRLAFEGGYLAYVGWVVLLELSLLTIIGWAWVLKFMLQWICRNVRGTSSFEFTGTGLEILWRTVVYALLCVLVIPIPWMMRWLYRWYISQIAVV